MSDQLHPNIARMAARYDQIVEAMTAGLLDPDEARNRLEQLEARDDHGVRWSIDPSTGQFLRRTAFGQLVPDTPPTYGLDTKDGFYYSDPMRADNPEFRLTSQEVQAPANPPASLGGATRFTQPDAADLVSSAHFDTDEYATRRSALVWVGVGILVAALVAFFIFTS